MGADGQEDEAGRAPGGGADGDGATELLVKASNEVTADIAGCEGPSGLKCDGSAVGAGVGVWFT